MAAQMSGAVKTFLEKPNLAVLATLTRSGRVQATPVWFMRTDGQILINTTRGRAKMRNMQANPRVTLTIIDREDPYRYVQIQGRVAKFDPENGAKDIDRLSQRYVGAPYSYPAADSPRNRVSVHIEPEHITAQGL
jgi:PPOX class probable F420-dependent enzyme